MLWYPDFLSGYQNVIQLLDFLSGYCSILRLPDFYASKSRLLCFDYWTFSLDIKASGYQRNWIAKHEISCFKIRILSGNRGTTVFIFFSTSTCLLKASSDVKIMVSNKIFGVESYEKVWKFMLELSRIFSLTFKHPHNIKAVSGYELHFLKHQGEERGRQYRGKEK